MTPKTLNFKNNFFSILPFKQLSVLFFLAFVSALAPFVSFWALSKTIDALSNLSQVQNVILYIIFIGAFLVTNDSFEAIRWTYSTYMEGKIFLEMKERLLEKVSKYAYIDIFENPDFLNKLRLADQLIPKFNSFFNSLAMLFSGVLGSLPFLWIGITTAWWVPLVLIAGFLPSLIIKWNLEERLWALEIQNGESYKEAAVHEHILLDSAFAKEIRLWNAASFILKRWKKNRYNLLRETSRLRNKSMGMTLLAHIFEGLVDCAVIAYLYILVSRSVLTTGAFVFAVTAVIQLRQNAFTVLLFGVDLKSDFNRLKPYFDVINYDETIIEKRLSYNEEIKAPQTAENAIVLKSLSFSYPKCEEKALKDINLEIKKGEKIALVGANGSGKSTLIKIISGMYPDFEGGYFFNGKNSKEIAVNDLRRSFAAVYQDFARFPMTFEENAAISEIAEQFNDEPDSFKTEKEEIKIDTFKFEELCKCFPIANSMLEPKTLLTRQFEGGLDLSGGQWQRLALMRCAWADREIILLDEPISALDPDSEHEVLEAMIELMKGKTAIVVTHRLALCLSVDRIIVVEDGSIAETGTHTELINKNGRYGEMFKKQSARYG